MGTGADSIVATRAETAEAAAEAAAVGTGADSIVATRAETAEAAGADSIVATGAVESVVAASALAATTWAEMAKYAIELHNSQA